VHSKFRLYLTTVHPLSSIPASLLSDLNVISLCPCVPLSQDVLLDAALQVLLPEKSSQLVGVCEEIAQGKKRLRALEAEMFSSLPREGRVESYWDSTEKINKIVQEKDEVRRCSGSPCVFPGAS
jgi:CMP-N-acetylneuraminic acid synthetase